MLQIFEAIVFLSLVILIYRIIGHMMLAPFMHLIELVCMAIPIIEFMLAGMVGMYFITKPFRAYLNLQSNPWITIIVYAIGIIWICGIFIGVESIKDDSDFVWIRYIFSGILIVVNAIVAHSFMIDFIGTTTGWKVVSWIGSGVIGILIVRKLQDEMGRRE